jgi:N-acetylglucosaminyldiphosphoundecaprenol N-acetyl-beta-D-mannosaminyltransferase
MPSLRSRSTETILNAKIDALTWSDALSRLIIWGGARESRYVCICNVHSVVTTTLDAEFMDVVNTADMATPDGAPVAWALRKLGFPAQERISGPDLMWRYLAVAERLDHSVFFYGSTPETLAKLEAAVRSHFPALKIAGRHSPPFRDATPDEDAAEVEMINNSGANVVFVGLGCPKQEKWMAAHKGRIRAVTVGVGAAFDYHSGVVKRAPLWWQKNGLEWLYRLMSEPRRLFKRYFVTNSLFVLGFSRQLFMQRFPRLTKTVQPDAR